MGVLRANLYGKETIISKSFRSRLIEPAGRIVSLKHNIFRLTDPKLVDYPVEHSYHDEFRNYVLINNEIIDAGPVESYFLKEYSQSSWRPHLEQSLKVISYPGKTD